MKTNRVDPVHMAVMRNDLPALREVLSKSKSIDSRDREGRIPLFYAAQDGNVAIASELLGHGADVNARDRNDESPLHFAAREYRIEMASLLLDHGASPNAQDANGNTALHRAVFESKGRGEIIKLLVARGADPVLANKSGVSPKGLATTIANYDVAAFFS